MDTITVTADETPDRPARRWSVGFVAAVLVYALAAFGAVPYLYLTDRSGELTDRPFLELLVDAYDHLGTLLYHIPAALAAWLLVRHSRHAVWAGGVVVAAVAWLALRAAVAVAGGGVEDGALWLGSELFELLLYSLLLVAMCRWRARGVLT